MNNTTTTTTTTTTAAPAANKPVQNWQRGKALAELTEALKAADTLLGFNPFNPSDEQKTLMSDYLAAWRAEQARREASATARAAKTASAVMPSIFSGVTVSQARALSRADDSVTVGEAYAAFLRATSKNDEEAIVDALRGLCTHCGPLSIAQLSEAGVKIGARQWQAINAAAMRLLPNYSPAKVANASTDGVKVGKGVITYRRREQRITSEFC